MAHDKHMNGDCAMPEHLRGVHHDLARPTDSICFHGEELQTLCEWFGVVQDLNPAYLEKKDYLIATRLYVCANRRVTNEMRAKLELSSAASL